jgi:hypothetical protein
MAVQSVQQQRGPLVRDGLAVLALFCATLTAVVLFLPAEGWLATPLHDGLFGVLGRTSFAVPLLLVLTGILILRRGRRTPTLRLIGLGVLGATALPAEHFLAPQSAGALGEALANALLSAVGGTGAALILVPGLVLGTFLVFKRAT